MFYSNQLRDDLKRIIIRAIKAAKHTLSIQIYGLTDSDVLAALSKASQRGVDITLFYDPSGSKNLPFGFPVKIPGLMHRKILVADEKLTLIGSANFTTQSLKMHSNVLIGLHGEEIARHFKNSVNDVAEFAVGQSHIKSYFLPDFEKKAFHALCQSLRGAKHSIELAMFTLTHPELVKELCDAAQRGVCVQIAIDPYTMKGSSRQAIQKLKEAGIPVLASRGKQLLHHKWALIDQKIFVVGSANWTKAAFSQNQDCFLIFDQLDPAHQKKVAKLWHAIAIASEKS